MKIDTWNDDRREVVINLLLTERGYCRVASIRTVSNERMSSRKTVLTIIGTRPEAIKMAPVIRELERHPSRFRSVLMTTEQHRELLDQAMAAFGLCADIHLGLMEADQGLSRFAARSLAAVSDALEELKPDMVLVQGDTTTVFTAALAAFYRHIPVGHVEAGLRSHDRENPFPEEANRRLATVLADLHFAPTARARRNLLASDVRDDRIFVTGNTIVDALQMILPSPAYDSAELESIASRAGRMIFVTAHRRENHGPHLRDICQAIIQIVRNYDDVIVVWPVHLNPHVVSVTTELLGHEPHVHLVPPATYGDALRLMHRSTLLLSDSGGVQEEAPSMHRPLLVLREVTERPEVIEVGAARLVGTDPHRIVREVHRLLSDDDAYSAMASAPNPFGDGHASRRIVSAIGHRLGLPDEEHSATDPVSHPPARWSEELAVST